ncbi:MAG: pseudouridine-5'-phosphate glycosidase [Phycisphaerales bacterium]
MPAVVALETAVVTHGLPRPMNLEIAYELPRLVEDAEAIPATIGVIEGEIVVGLSPDEIERLANDDDAGKLSARDLAWANATRASGGLTVAGVLAVCRLVGIRVFATGGIGGVHRGWTERPDVSADLAALGRTPTCVVSAGAKSILDIPATLEALDSLGVPVIGWGVDHFPQFHSRGSDAARVSMRADDLGVVARMLRAQWFGLESAAGALLANPISDEHAMPHEEIEAGIAAALERAEREGVTGAALTPFLLDALAEMTGGRSIDANLALLRSNARLAGELAAACAGR